MPKRRKKPDDLDTTTTFVNMNVEGFKWYDPTLEKRLDDKKKGMVQPKITRKEYWQMVRAAFAAALPAIFMMCLIFGLLVCFAYLWLS